MSRIPPLVYNPDVSPLNTLPTRFDSVVRGSDPTVVTNSSAPNAVAARQGVDSAAQRQADLQKRELMLDLGQMVLDIIGIVDPTPISDGANGITSLFRGDFLGAGISALGMLPYVGDLAKVGKLGKYVRTMGRIVDIARTDARFAEAVRPMLTRLRGALDRVPFDSLPEAARRPLQELKGKVDEFFAPRPAATNSDTFTGTLRGARVELPGVSVQQVSYTKRARAELDRLRAAFNSTERASFVRSLANDPQKVAKLREAGLSDAQIQMLRDGRIPQGWQVHHKLPLDDGGTNAHSNLVLIKNEPYHKVITNAQNAATRGMTEGQTRILDWPIPEGFVYPPRP